MKVVVDTNVFVSAVFFGGVPGQILGMWRSGDVNLTMTEEILLEYVDVLQRLARRYPGIDPDPIIGLVVQRGVFVQPVELKDQVCVDSDDDKFIAAAIGGSAEVIISGDRHLLDVSGHRGLPVMKPAEFVEQFSKRQ